MFENLIVGLIVAGAGWSAWLRYRPGKKTGCGSGGGSCESCKACDTPAPPAGQRVIRIHAR